MLVTGHPDKLQGDRTTSSKNQESEGRKILELKLSGLIKRRVMQLN